MTKIAKPLTLFLLAIAIIAGGGYWWFSRTPLTSEFIAVIPDQAYIDWEQLEIATVDADRDRIADRLWSRLVRSADADLPILVALSYDQSVSETIKQLDAILNDRPSQFYSAASMVATTANRSLIEQIAQIHGVVMVEEDVIIAGLSRADRGPSLALATTPASTNTVVALLDGGTTYPAVHREWLAGNVADVGLRHGDLVATNILQVDPSAVLVDVAVLDSAGVAPVSRLIKGINWTIDNQARYNIATVNVSAGYLGDTNFSFNRALSAAAAKQLAVVVSVADHSQAGRVAAKVPRVVRVGVYDSALGATPTNYDKQRVDILAPVNQSVSASVAAAQLSGAVAKLMTDTGQSSTDSTDRWRTLSLTFTSIEDVITLTEDQLGQLISDDPVVVDLFMSSLEQYLQAALTQLEQILAEDSPDGQLLRELLGSVSQLNPDIIGGVDLDQTNSLTDWDSLWGELWQELEN